MANTKCPFYEYEDRVFSYTDRCRSNDRPVDMATYKKYCSAGESYWSKCPFFDRTEDSSSSGCYLTSACVEAMGLPDDCEELTTLRTFRDGWLAAQEGGKEEIERYYRLPRALLRRFGPGARSSRHFPRCINTWCCPALRPSSAAI